MNQDLTLQEFLATKTARKECPLELLDAELSLNLFRRYTPLDDADVFGQMLREKSAQAELYCLGTKEGYRQLGSAALETLRWLHEYGTQTGLTTNLTERHTPVGPIGEPENVAGLGRIYRLTSQDEAAGLRLFLALEEGDLVVSVLFEVYTLDHAMPPHLQVRATSPEI
ncbi:MAG TPA: hypothetical protein VJJ47_01405 [Candidatus Paceibacterota bacterium]